MEIITQFFGSQIATVIKFGLFIYLYHRFQIAEVISFPTLWVYILSNVICFIVAIIVIGLLFYFGINSITDEIEKHDDLKNIKDMFDD